MTVAVIADVHGNAWALDAVLADARDRGADTFLDLGRPEHHDWLAALPAMAEHEDLVLVHGAPHDDRADWAGPLATGWP